MLSIVIPCYNEIENITELIQRLSRVLKYNKIEGELIIVDDNSPDGTGQILKELKNKYPNLRVITRENKNGLGTAVIKGFKIAKGDILLTMDADLSHPPELIPKLIEPIRRSNCEITVASRYIKSGEIKGWSFKRKLLSKSAILLAKMVTTLSDPMSGFFSLKRSVLDGIELKGKGQKIGLEIIAKGNYNNIIEVPYVFVDRKHGESKLTRKTVMKNIYNTLSLILSKNSILGKFLKTYLL